MVHHIYRTALVLILCDAIIFTPQLYATQTQLAPSTEKNANSLGLEGEPLVLPPSDMVAPEVIHEAISGLVAVGAEQKISATVTDNQGIESVVLFYRAIGEKNYDRVLMNRSSDTDIYTSIIKQIPAPGIEYYIQARDLAGNTLLHGYFFSPLVVNASSAPAFVTEDVLASVAVTDPERVTDKDASGFPMKWVWIGVGVLAVGAIAASGGGDSDTAPTSTGATVTVKAPIPGQ